MAIDSLKRIFGVPAIRKERDANTALRGRKKQKAPQSAKKKGVDIRV